MPEHSAPDLAHRGRGPLSRAVVGLGLVSLLTDAATEMAIPLLPLLLASMTASPAMALGIVEGVADAVASVLKLLSGRWSDRTRRRRPFVLAGYSLSSLARPLLALAQVPWHVVTIRVLDRVGKGLRSSPRDALLAAEASPAHRGYVFGFHRGMDHLGAVLGPLVALLVLWRSDDDLRWVFALTAVPGVLAILAIVFLVGEPRPIGAAVGDAERPAPGRGGGRGLWRVLVPVGLFSLGNASDVFLLLKVAQSRADAHTLPLLWVMLHLVKTVAAPLGGALVDKTSPRRVVALAWLYYAAIYVAFSWTHATAADAGLFVAYGIFHGLSEPAEKAMVASLVSERARGTAFGWYHLVSGLAALPAGLGFGAVWERFGAPTAFLTAAILAVGATGLLLVVGPNTRTRP